MSLRLIQCLVLGLLVTASCSEWSAVEGHSAPPAKLPLDTTSFLKSPPAGGREDWKQFRARFDAAGIVPIDSIVGEWVEVRQIMTARFQSGIDGPDRVFDHPSDVSVDWMTATVRMGLALRREADSVKARDFLGGPPGDARLASNSLGELLYAPDLGGDGDTTLRCRLATDDRLLCTYRNADGWGVEFKRHPWR